MMGDGGENADRGLQCHTEKECTGHHNTEQRLYCSAAFHQFYLSPLPQMHSKPNSLITDCLQTMKTELTNIMVLTVHGFIITAELQTI